MAPSRVTGTSSSSSATPPTNIFHDGAPIPKLIVFDLDYTLWPFWIDTHVTPPLKPTPHGITDRYGESLAFYPDVPSILSTLDTLRRDKGVKVASASRTSAPDLARSLLKLLTVEGPAKKKAFDVFDKHEIFPGDKKQHFARLHKATGIEYKDMLFFDDESRNRNVESLGVTMCLVRDGVSWGEMERGLREWRAKR